jgi:hypothetical protein
MKSAIDKALSNPVPFAIAGALLIGVVYFLARKTVKDAAAAVGGLVSGNNVITQNQHDFSGEEVTAYEGTGVLGTLGATVNTVTGGAAASAGSALGNVFTSIFGKKVVSPSTFYSVLFPDGVRHAIGDTWIDKNGYFTYPQGGTIRYKLGTLNGKQIATKAA